MKVTKYNKPTNTKPPRTLYEIYPHPLDNKQGGHECINLHTIHVITGYNVNYVPVTDLVIKYF